MVDSDLSRGWGIVPGWTTRIFSAIHQARLFQHSERIHVVHGATGLSWASVYLPSNNYFPRYWGLLLIFGYAANNGQLSLAADDRKLVCLLGLINPTAYYLILFAAYDRLPAHIAQPINYTCITLALLAVPLLGQRLGKRTLAGSYQLSGCCSISSHHPRRSRSCGCGYYIGFVEHSPLGCYATKHRSNAQPASIMFWSFTVAAPN